MIELKDLIASKEFWKETIQNDMFRAMDSFMKENGINSDEVSKRTGIAPAGVRRIMNGEFDGTLDEMIRFMLALGRVPSIVFRPIDEEVVRQGPYQKLMERKGRKGRYFQMQDVLLAAGELNKRERVAVAWLLDKVEELHDAYEKDRMRLMGREPETSPATSS